MIPSFQPRLVFLSVLLGILLLSALLGILLLKTSFINGLTLDDPAPATQQIFLVNDNEESTNEGSSGTLGLLVKLAILQSLLMCPSLTTDAGAGCPAVTCPAGYMKLDDQRISPNCYFYGGRNDARSWHSADAECTSTSGAHLLVPDSLAEIEALRRKFGIGDNDGDVWTGANDLRCSGNFMFKVNMVNNKNCDFNALPFGVENESGMRGSPSCIEIELNSNGVACTETENYICELPVVCNTGLFG